MCLDLLCQPNCALRIEPHLPGALFVLFHVGYAYPHPFYSQRRRGAYDRNQGMQGIG